MHSLLEETMDALPDSVLDSVVPTSQLDPGATIFSQVDVSSVPPLGREQELLATS